MASKRTKEERNFFVFLYQVFERKRNNFRRASGKRGITKKELGERLGVTAQYIGRLLDVDSKEHIPSYDLCKKIASVLKFSRSELYGLLSLHILAKLPCIKEVSLLGSGILPSMPKLAEDEPTETLVMDLDEFRMFSMAVLEAMPYDINPVTARRWVENPLFLAETLKKSLCKYIK